MPEWLCPPGPVPGPLQPSKPKLSFGTAFDHPLAHILFQKFAPNFFLKLVRLADSQIQLNESEQPKSFLSLCNV